MRHRLARLARDEIADRIGQLVGEMLKPLAIGSEVQTLVADHIETLGEPLDRTRVVISIELEGRPETRREVFGARIAA